MLRPVIPLLFLATPLAAQAGVPTGIEWWAGTWDQALAEARNRNVPLLVAFIQDGEEANDRIVAGLYQDKSFHKLCAGVVAVVACQATHKPADQGGRQVCSRFGHITCTQHRNLEIDTRPIFWPGNFVKTPAHVIAFPDGKESGRILDVEGTGSYEAAVKDAARKLGRGLTRAEFQKVLEAIRGARGALRNDDVAAVRPHLDVLDQLTPGTPLTKERDALAKDLGDRGQKHVAEVTALAAGERAIEALQLLERLLPAYKGLPVQVTLKALEAKVRGTPAGRAALRTLEKEARARPHLERAEQAEREAAWIQAYTQYHAAAVAGEGTPAFDRAAARIAALAADPDIGKLIRERREQDAAKALDAVRLLIEKGDRDRAKARIAVIERLYGGTAAAAAAEKLLGGGG